MRKFTFVLALCLATGGAFAQITAPEAVKLLNAEQLQNGENSKRIFLKAVSKTNSNWFTGQISTTDLSDARTLFEVEKKDNNYVLKRLSTGEYIQPQEASISFGAAGTAQLLDLLTIARTSISDQDLQGQEPYVRFKKNTSEMFLNVQSAGGTPKFAGGKGAWSVVNVYDASEYYFVTLNIVKDGATQQIKKVYKVGDNIEIPTFEGYTTDCASVKKTADDNQTLDVNYYISIEAAKEIAKKEGKVGYPKNFEGLKTAIAAAEKEGNEANLKAMVDEIAKLYNSTDINLPVNGKTYVFTNHHLKNDGTVAQNYLTYNEQGLTLVGRGETTAENYPQAAKFTCHEVETDKYLFVNNEGKYLVLKGNQNDVGTNGNKGFVEKYDATFCPLTVQKDAKAGAKTKQQFGLLSFGGQRNTPKNINSYFTITFSNNNFSFNQSTGFAFLNDNNHSTAFSIEEVAYANTPELKAIEGKAIQIQGAKSIATFSAPFATLVPEGVKAYYIAADGYTNGQTIAKLTAVDAGKAIPANQGVILTGTETGRVKMVPAAAEAVAELTGNQLGHTAGATKVVTENLYVLGKSGENVGFFKAKANTKLGMNKAYLMSTTQTAAIELQFGNEVTGIDAVESATNEADAPIYDLTGRRVNATVKGGIYIQNGKKFIVK